MYEPVAYLYFAVKDGTTRCCFVMGKFQLALIRTLTIPRQESNATVIGVKLYNIIIYEIDLSIEKNKSWSDSTEPILEFKRGVQYVQKGHLTLAT